MDRLDRYVVRILCGAYGGSLVFMMFVSVLTDLIQNAGRYLDRAEGEGFGVATTVVLLVRYYAEMAPVIFVTVAPFLSVVAGMVTVLRLMHTNEMVPMLFSGRRITRVLRPVLATGLVSGLAMMACWEYVIPATAESTASSRSLLMPDLAVLENVIVEPADDRLRLFAEEYRPRELTMRSLVVLDEREDRAILVSAEAALWVEESRDWRLSGGAVSDGVTTRPREWLGYPEITPHRLWQAGRAVKGDRELSYSELWALYRERPARHDYLMYLHHNIAYPVANLVLLLLALPFAVSFERGSKIRAVVQAIGICGAYLVVDLVSGTLGQRAYLHPVAAAWTPTILFGSLGLVLFSEMRT